MKNSYENNCNTYIYIFLLLLLKKVGSARLRESDIHPSIAPQYQPIDRKNRNGKRGEDYSSDRAAWANKKTLALLTKPFSTTPSDTGLARSFQRDTERGIKVLLYCEVLQRGDPYVPMCDEGSACNPQWHIWSR